MNDVNQLVREFHKKHTETKECLVCKAVESGMKLTEIEICVGRKQDGAYAMWIQKREAKNA